MCGAISAGEGGISPSTCCQRQTPPPSGTPGVEPPQTKAGGRLVSATGEPHTQPVRSPGPGGLCDFSCPHLKCSAHTLLPAVQHGYGRGLGVQEVILTLEVSDKGCWLYHAPAVLKSLSHVVLHDTYHAEAVLVTCSRGEDDRPLGTNTVEIKVVQETRHYSTAWSDVHHIPFQSHTSTASAACMQPSAPTQAWAVWDTQLGSHKASRSRWSHLSPGYTHHGHKRPQTQGCKAQECCYGREKGALHRNSISVEKWAGGSREGSS